VVDNQIISSTTKKQDHWQLNTERIVTFLADRQYAMTPIPWISDVDCTVSMAETRNCCMP